MSDETNESSAREQRVNEAIAAYLNAVDAGEAPEAKEFIAAHSDIKAELESFFANRDEFERLAEPLQPTSNEPPKPLPDDVTLPPTGQSTEAPTLAPTETAGAAIGTTVRYFGDYELLEEIARGGMGVVYKARQVSLNRIVALKMILAGQLAAEEDVKRFYTEAQAAATLDHPGIVPIFEVGEHEGQHYFSMGFVEGSSLSAKVVDGPLPPRQAAEYTKKVTEAVAYAHQHGVIHRDLKPANVLLASGGRQPADTGRGDSRRPSGDSRPPLAEITPKVTDFGLAKKVEGDSELTATGQILGTPSYMPPEQASGKTDEVTETADVYSLGAILYNLLTGRPPFQADNPLDTLMQVLEQNPVSPRQLNPKVPRDLETICLKCLAKESRRRYASAQELVDDLERFLDGEAILARPVAPWERAWRWVYRKRRMVAAAVGAAALAGLIAFVVIAGWRHYRGGAVREQAEAFVEAVKSGDEAAVSRLLTEKAQQDYSGDLLESIGVPTEFRDARYEIGDATMAGDEAQIPIRLVRGDDKQEIDLRLRRGSRGWLVHRIQVTGQTVRITKSVASPEDGGGFFFEPEPGETPEPWESMDVTTFEAAWKVDLDVKDQPAGEIINRLAGELGMNCTHRDDQQAVLSSPVTLKLSGSRLEAIEGVCRQVGLHPEYSADATWGAAPDVKLTLEEGPRPWPAVFAGPFLVEVEDIRHAAPQAVGRLKLRVRAFGLLELVADRVDWPKLVEILPAEIHDPSVHGGSGGDLSAALHIQQNIPLKNLLRSVKEITALRGEISLSLPVSVERVRFEELEPGVTRQVGDAKVTLQSVGEDEPCELEFEFESDDLDHDDIQLIAYDAEGQILRQPMGGMTAGNYRSILASKRPASVTVSFVTRTEEVKYAYEFRNIPLPNHGLMPDGLAALAYLGHDAPVTVEFVKIVSDSHFPKIQLRAANHSNKAIRSLEMTLDYLDAKGSSLKEWKDTHTGDQDRESGISKIVGPNETAEFEATAHFMPKDTERVAIRLQHVVFADATEWQPAAGPGQISGKITLQGSRPEGWISVGCLGKNPDGQLEGPAISAKADASSSSSLTCKTWEPRNTTLRWGGISGGTHRHVNRPPGRYLVYLRGYRDTAPDGEVRYEGYYDWEWVEIRDEKSAVVADLQIDPANLGALEVVVKGPTKESSVVYLPLDDDGELPLPGAHYYSSRMSCARIQDGKTVIRGLREGKYQVAMAPWQRGARSPDGKRIVEMLPSVTANVEVKRGSTAKVELAVPAATPSQKAPAKEATKKQTPTSTTQPKVSSAPPDLKIARVHLEEGWVRAIVKNGGGTKATGFDVVIYVDGRSKATRFRANLPAGKESFLLATSLQRGTHAYKVVVDPDDKVRESDETNNSKEETFSSPR